MGKLRKLLQWIRNDALRPAAPFLVIMLGAICVTAYDTAGWSALFVAGVFWTWAIDLAGMRAKAEEQSRIAERIIDALTNGNDTDITVTINRQSTRED